MARNFRELQSKMSLAAQARSAEKARKMMAEMSLHELRSARAITQEHLASVLGVRQASVSKKLDHPPTLLSTRGRATANG